MGPNGIMALYKFRIIIVIMHKQHVTGVISTFIWSCIFFSGFHNVKSVVITDLHLGHMLGSCLLHGYHRRLRHRGY